MLALKYCLPFSSLSANPAKFRDIYFGSVVLPDSANYPSSAKYPRDFGRCTCGHARINKNEVGMFTLVVISD